MIGSLLTYYTYNIIYYSDICFLKFSLVKILYKSVGDLGFKPYLHQKLIGVLTR